MSIILSVLGALFKLILFVGVGIVVAKVSYNEDADKMNMKAMVAYIIIASTIWLGSMSIAVVPANSVGVKYSMISGVSEKTLPEGAHFKIPFIDKVTLIDTKVQQATVEGVSIQTKDSQYLTVDFNVKFSVLKANAFVLYSKYGSLESFEKSVISNYGQKALELTITEYNIIEALGDKKTEIYGRATEILADLLREEGVTLNQLTIIDMDAGAAIEQAISDEAVAKKAVETAEQTKLKAEKDAETAKIKADSAAEVKVIEAEAAAKANKLLVENLDDEILTKLFIEKWDGVMPIVYGADGSILDVSSLMK